LGNNRQFDKRRNAERRRVAQNRETD